MNLKAQKGMGTPSMESLRTAFFNKTVQSRRIFEHARRVLPGGAARGATAFSPYPFTVGVLRGLTSLMSMVTTTSISIWKEAGLPVRPTVALLW